MHIHITVLSTKWLSDECFSIHQAVIVNNVIPTH